MEFRRGISRRQPKVPPPFLPMGAASDVSDSEALASKAIKSTPTYRAILDAARDGRELSEEKASALFEQLGRETGSVSSASSMPTGAMEAEVRRKPSRLRRGRSRISPSSSFLEEEEEEEAAELGGGALARELASTADSRRRLAEAAVQAALGSSGMLLDVASSKPQGTYEDVPSISAMQRFAREQRQLELSAEKASQEADSMKERAEEDARDLRGRRRGRFSKRFSNPSSAAAQSASRAATTHEDEESGALSPPQAGIVTAFANEHRNSPYHRGIQSSSSSVSLASRSRAPSSSFFVDTEDEIELATNVSELGPRKTKESIFYYSSEEEATRIESAFVALKRASATAAKPSSRQLPVSSSSSTLSPSLASPSLLTSKQQDSLERSSPPSASEAAWSSGEEMEARMLLRKDVKEEKERVASEHQLTKEVDDLSRLLGLRDQMSPRSRAPIAQFVLAAATASAAGADIPAISRRVQEKMQYRETDSGAALEYRDGGASEGFQSDGDALGIDVVDPGEGGGGGLGETLAGSKETRRSVQTSRPKPSLLLPSEDMEQALHAYARLFTEEIVAHVSTLHQRTLPGVDSDELDEQQVIDPMLFRTVLLRNGIYTDEYAAFGVTKKRKGASAAVAGDREGKGKKGREGGGSRDTEELSRAEYDLQTREILQKTLERDSMWASEVPSDFFPLIQHDQSWASNSPDSKAQLLNAATKQTTDGTATTGDRLFDESSDGEGGLTTTLTGDGPYEDLTAQRNAQNILLLRRRSEFIRAQEAVNEAARLLPQALGDPFLLALEPQLRASATALGLSAQDLRKAGVTLRLRSPSGLSSSHQQHLVAPPPETGGLTSEFERMDESQSQSLSPALSDASLLESETVVMTNSSIARGSISNSSSSSSLQNRKGRQGSSLRLSAQDSITAAIAAASSQQNGVRASSSSLLVPDSTLLSQQFMADGGTFGDAFADGVIIDGGKDGKKALSLDAEGVKAIASAIGKTTGGMEADQQQLQEARRRTSMLDSSDEEGGGGAQQLSPFSSSSSPTPQSQQRDIARSPLLQEGSTEMDRVSAAREGAALLKELGYGNPRGFSDKYVASLAGAGSKKKKATQLATAAAERIEHLRGLDEARDGDEASLAAFVLKEGEKEDTNAMTVKGGGGGNLPSSSGALSPAAPSLVPAGYKTWADVSAAQSSNEKRVRASKKALKAHIDVQLSRRIQPVKDASAPPPLRTLRVSENIRRVIEAVFSSRIVPDPELYPGGVPIEVAQVEVTPDLQRAYVRWSLPFPVLAASESALESTASPRQAASAASLERIMQANATTTTSSSHGRSSIPAAAAAAATAATMYQVSLDDLGLVRSPSRSLPRSHSQPSPSSYAARAKLGRSPRDSAPEDETEEEPLLVTSPLTASLLSNMSKRNARDRGMARISPPQDGPSRKALRLDSTSSSSSSKRSLSAAASARARFGESSRVEHLSHAAASLATKTGLALERHAAVIKRAVGERLGMRRMPTLEFHRRVKQESA